MTGDLLAVLGIGSFELECQSQIPKRLKDIGGQRKRGIRKLTISNASLPDTSSLLSNNQNYKQNHLLMRVKLKKILDNISNTKINYCTSLLHYKIIKSTTIVKYRAYVPDLND